MLPVCGGSALDIDYWIVKTGYALILHVDLDLFLCNMTIKKTAGNGCGRDAGRRSREKG